MTCEQSDTAKAGKQWTDGLVDVLFVDADHSYAGTMANVESWLPHMDVGGRVIFHDNNEIHPGVMQAIDELKQNPRFRFFNPGKYSGSIAVAEVT
jgi:hypothetical protein